MFPFCSLHSLARQASEAGRELRAYGYTLLRCLYEPCCSVNMCSLKAEPVLYPRLRRALIAEVDELELASCSQGVQRGPIPRA